MAQYNDYEIRLFGPLGELQRVIPLVAESENIARMRAGLLCSEHGAESFEVHPEKQAQGPK
jgi:hypothetical protein